MEHMRALCEYIRRSPTAYHAVDEVVRRLSSLGYEPLTDTAVLRDGVGYYTVRADSSLIAFRYHAGATGFRIAAAHTDTPTFRVKPSVERASAVYTSLDVERYGGMIYSTWLDRPLSVAGRVYVRTGDGVERRLVCLEEDLCVIPSVAIHLQRGVNEGYKWNPAVDLLPLLSDGRPEGRLLARVADALGVKVEQIVSHDLFLYNREQGRAFGASGEFLLSPRLDDLACVYACLEGFLAEEAQGTVPVLALFHNEEVGSATKQGAASNLLSDVLCRIGAERIGAMLAHSFMVSADNAHALHPNHPELSDRENAPRLNGGVVVKFNASERYTTDGLSHACFATLCERAGVPVQTYCNRADLPGGSTLGSIATTRVPVYTVDIGVPQLAMHAATETCGIKDIAYAVEAMRAVFSTPMDISDAAITFA